MKGSRSFSGRAGCFEKGTICHLVDAYLLRKPVLERVRVGTHLAITCLMKNVRTILVILLALSFSRGAFAFSGTNLGEACPLQSLSNAEELNAFALDVVRALVDAAERYAQDDDEKTQVMCTIKDAAEQQLSCQAGDEFDELTADSIESILRCIRTGSIRKTSFGWEGEIEVNSSPLGKFLSLVSLSFTVKGPTSESVEFTWTCTDTQSEETYTGTLEDVKAKYRRNHPSGGGD
jgi:hypothetical protein